MQRLPRTCFHDMFNNISFHNLFIRLEHMFIYCLELHNFSMTYYQHCKLGWMSQPHGHITAILRRIRETVEFHKYPEGTQIPITKGKLRKDGLFWHRKNDSRR